MKLTINYGQDVVVLPLRPLTERAKKATKNDLCLLFVLASDARLRADYTAEADRAAAEAGVSRAELDRALSFWQGAGLIDVEQDEHAEVESVHPVPAAPPAEKKQERETVLPHYTTEQRPAPRQSRWSMRLSRPSARCSPPWRSTSCWA